MGNPNPAKLANFPEVDVFVMIADPLGFLLDSKVRIYRIYLFKRG
jgi:diphthamide biosynthesis protein 2